MTGTSAWLVSAHTGQGTIVQGVSSHPDLGSPQWHDLLFTLLVTRILHIRTTHHTCRHMHVTCKNMTHHMWDMHIISHVGTACHMRAHAGTCMSHVGTCMSHTRCHMQATHVLRHTVCTDQSILLDGLEDGHVVRQWLVPYQELYAVTKTPGKVISTSSGSGRSGTLTCLCYEQRVPPPGHQASKHVSLIRHYTDSSVAYHDFIHFTVL